jgi:hypothetical protein
MSTAAYVFEVGDQAWTGADTRGRVDDRRHHDGANLYSVGGRWWAEAELERGTAPAATPLINDADIDLLVLALGRMARDLYQHPDQHPPFTWKQAVSLQTRIGANKQALTVIAAGVAPVASMAEIPTSGTE